MVSKISIFEENMKQVEKIYKSVPFWSLNDTLKKDELVKQVEWMNENGVCLYIYKWLGFVKY